MFLHLRAFVCSLLAAFGSWLPAQCYEPDTGISLGTGDDVVFPIRPLGFAFPFGGTTYTHVHVSTNGLVYLSNAGVPAPGNIWGGIPSLLVTGGPKIAPFLTDLFIDGSVGGAVEFHALPGRVVVTWENARLVGDPYSVIFSVQLQLLAGGEIRFAYDERFLLLVQRNILVGMSQGGGAAIPPASELSTAGGSATTTNYQVFDRDNVPFDMDTLTLTFQPSGVGYTWDSAICSGTLTSSGAGCYTASDSFYQLTLDPPTSSAVLSNTAITMTPNTTGGGYTVTSGGNAFVAPTAAAVVLPLTDDDEISTPALATPFPYEGGVAATFAVCSNGIVSVAPGNSLSYAPDLATMLNNPQTAWYSWHDYDPGAALGGRVLFEEIGAVTYITWDGVLDIVGWPVPSASTFQFQFDSATGTVTLVYLRVSAENIPSLAAQPHLVGYSPGGVSNVPAGVSFATDLTISFGSYQLDPLWLWPSGKLISTPWSGSTVTYFTSNIPEFTPGSSVFVALQVLSFSQLPDPGVDLAFLGAPGCDVRVAALDILLPMVATTNLQSVDVDLDAGVPPGLFVYSQSAALFVPNTLANGQNDGGLTTSNMLAQRVGYW